MNLDIIPVVVLDRHTRPDARESITVEGCSYSEHRLLTQPVTVQRREGISALHGTELTYLMLLMLS